MQDCGLLSPESRVGSEVEDSSRGERRRGVPRRASSWRGQGLIWTLFVARYEATLALRYPFRSFALASSTS